VPCQVSAQSNVRPSGKKGSTHTIEYPEHSEFHIADVPDETSPQEAASFSGMINSQFSFMYRLMPTSSRTPHISVASDVGCETVRHGDNHGIISAARPIR
jgi:hypothetical protein